MKARWPLISALVGSSALPSVSYQDAAPSVDGAPGAPLEATCGTAADPRPIQRFIHEALATAHTPETLTSAFTRLASMSPDPAWAWSQSPRPALISRIRVTSRVPRRNARLVTTSTAKSAGRAIARLSHELRCLTPRPLPCPQARAPDRVARGRIDAYVVRCSIRFAEPMAPLHAHFSHVRRF
jgi:hypothetical protein